MPLIFIQNGRRAREVHSEVLPRPMEIMPVGLMVCGCGNSGCDMVEVDRVGNTRHLVDVTQETMQVQVIADAVLVALKVGDIDRIEANQRGPQANVRFRQAIARQVAMLAQDLLQTLQRFKTFPTASSYASWLVAKPAL